MLAKTEGIVFRSYKYSETSIISKVFTREFGLCSFIVYGVRGSRNKSKGNLFQPLQFLELDIYHHPNRSILRLREHKPAYIYNQLYADIVRQSVALFSLEVLSRCVQEHEVNQELYDFFRSYLTDLDTMSRVDPLSPQRALRQIAKILGLEPYIDQPFDALPYFNLETSTYEPTPNHTQTSLSRTESWLLYSFLTEDSPSFNKAERLKLLDILITYFKYHIPGFHQVTSLDILKSILN